MFQAGIVGSPVVVTPYAYILLEDGTMYTIDMQSGIATDQYPIGGRASIPPISAGDGSIAVFGTDSGKIEAINQRGKLWEYSPMAFDMPDAPAGNLSLAGLASGGGHVYAVYNSYVAALDENSGRIVWMLRLGKTGGPAAADNDRLYYISGDELVSHRHSSDKPDWAIRVGDVYKTSPSPDPDFGLVYVATTRGVVYAVEASSGNVRWTYSINGWAMSTPSPAGGKAVFGTNDGKIKAVDVKTGKTAWSTDAGSAAWSKPLVLEREGEAIVLAGTNKGDLVGIDPQDGSIKFTYPLSGRAGSPTLGPDGRTVLIPTNEQKLYAVIAWPICTFDYPKTNEFIGPQIEARGRAWSWGGVKNVKISANSEQFPIVAAGSDGRFKIELDMSMINEGDVALQCIAEDNKGMVEQDASSSKSIPIISPLAPKLKLNLSIPSTPKPGAKFQVYVTTEQGNDAKGVLLEHMGKNMTIDSPLELVAPNKEGEFKLTARKIGYESASATLYVRQGDNGGIPALIVAGIALIVIVLFGLSKLKRKPAAPTDYSNPQAYDSTSGAQEREGPAA